MSRASPELRPGAVPKFWTEAAKRMLRQLWFEGLSTVDIGVLMETTKNAIIGQAHRLELPARPSPIRRKKGWSAPPSKPRRVAEPNRYVIDGAPVPHRPPQRREPALCAVEVPVLALVPVTPAPEVVAKPRPVTTDACCWPEGDPGRPGFRFCGEPVTAPGRSYCPAHVARAYLRVRQVQT